MRSLITIISLSLGVACSEPDDVPYVPPNNEDPVNMGNSCDTTILPIASDDAALGYSADDILAFAGTSFSTDMIWLDDETSVPLDISVSYNGGAIELYDSEPVPDTGGFGDIVSCDDSLSIEVDLHFTTNDDSFDESATLRLWAYNGVEASFWSTFGEHDLDGTYLFDLADTSGYDEFNITISGVLYDDGSTRGWVSAAGGAAFGGGTFVDSYSISAWPTAEYL
jgi:hypothetical protein